MKKLFTIRARHYGAVFLISFLALASHAALVGPYAPDASTLHLWHINESTTPVIDAVSSGGTNLTALQNGATLANVSLSGFGTALSTLGSGPNFAGAQALSPLALPNDGTAITYADPVSGAFTYEAIVQIGYNPAANLGATAVGGNGRNTPLTIIAGEGNSSATRLFTFRLDPVGFNPNAGGFTSPLTQPALEFINLNKAVSVQNILMLVPTSGPDAIVQNGWYHVAITYNGQPGTANNLNFYWTLMDTNRTSASLLGSATMNLNLATGVAPNFTIGNTGRGPGGSTTTPVNANFLGLIDEIRMSKVARSASQMQFIPSVISIDVDLTNQVTVLGQTVSFVVSASGVPPLRYIWKHNDATILGATQAVYTIPAVSVGDTGNYYVIVSNNTSVATSSIVSLTLRTPDNLTWVGSGYGWDVASSPAWTDTNGFGSVYTDGDNVTFDDSGAGFSSVTLASPVYPSSVVVNSASDYVFTTIVNGGLFGASGLIKQGTGSLLLDINNGNTGPTLIGNGAIQVGVGGTRGSLGMGPVTNNGGLLFNRTDTLVVSNNIAGTGGLTNGGTGNVTLSGSNTYSGVTAVSAGTLTLGNSSALGSSPQVIVTSTSGGALGGTRVALNSGVAIPAGVALSLPSDNAANSRSILFANGTSSWNGPINLNGDGTIAFGGTSPLSVGGAVGSSSFTGTLQLRGNGGGGGGGSISGVMTLSPASVVQINDGVTWIVSSTGNTWGTSQIANGTLQVGHNNALPVNTTVQLGAAGNGILDLGGFSQQIGGLSTAGTATNQTIGSSSTSSDATLIYNGGASTYGGNLVDVVGSGTHKMALTVAGGTLTLAGVNTFSGDTTISGGTLALTGTVAIANSPNINISAGATLDVSARTGGSLTVAANQTLKGDGTFNIVGSLVAAGTVELKLNKSGATLSNDSIQGLSQITYGGTLKLDLSGNPLVGSEAFKLFNATTYSGAFTTLTPATPGPGLAWDTRTLGTDGTLRVLPIPVMGSSMVVGGTNLTMSGSHGPILGTYVIVASSRIALARFRWTPVATNTFDASGNFTCTIPIDPELPHMFYSIKVP